eukprot:Hpha_TRINITY_DN16976_c1_g1::TRINITY_DN16976_c1_g1_i3::g.57033::m.57033
MTSSSLRRAPSWKTKLLYRLRCEHPELTIVGMTCADQCPSVEAGRKSFKAIDYEVTKEIFGGKLVKFEYCPEYARYDEELLQTLRDFKRTKRCRSEQALDPSLRVNLCKRNLKRLEICRRLSEADPEGVRIGKINYCVEQLKAYL